MRTSALVWIIGGTLTCFTPASAVVDKFDITADEHAACDDDVMRLCSEAFPDQDKVVACMKAKRAQLTAVCRTTFVAGMKRRHIPL